MSSKNTESAPAAVAGHALLSNGAAYTEQYGQGVVPLDAHSQAGYGFALCECGERSGDLETGAARHEWHRDHKAEVSG